jgi:hypothetical protein
VSAFIVMACVYALLLWWHWRYLDAAKEIVGCKHTRGTLRETVPDRRGRMTALTWYCSECSWQHQLPRLVRLPNGTWWLLDESGSHYLRHYEETDEHTDDPEVGQGGEGGVHPEA